MTKRRVVITGIGTINPLGNNVAEYFANLKNGVSGCRTIESYDTSKMKTKFACQIKGYNADDYFDRKEVRKLDPYAQYALIAAEQAMNDAAFDLEKVDKERAGVIFASGIGGLDSIYKEISDVAKGDGTPRFSPFFVTKMIPDMAAGLISMKYGFMGVNLCTVSACASSNHALVISADQIRMGRCDIVIAGGSDAAASEAGIGGFNSMMALSTRNDDPQTASRPYDVDRDGFVVGEGSGALVLEELEHALARGAKIYAEVIGGGMSADAYHITAPHPEGLGARKAMVDAITEAGIDPTEIDYVNAHGTSTPAGDLPELEGIRKAIGDHIYNINISATKSMTGHLLGAAGAIEALACVMAITEGIVPPTINNFNRDPNIDPRINLTLNKAQKRDVRVALSNTFGFGGHNSAVLLKKYE